MAAGIAVRGNLLCVTWSAARGHVFLFDLEAGQRVSAWTLPVGPAGYCDAGGVAMDEHYHLFVADPHNDRVRHYNAFGRHLGDFGAPGPDPATPDATVPVCSIARTRCNGAGTCSTSPAANSRGGAACSASRCVAPC